MKTTYKIKRTSKMRKILKIYRIISSHILSSIIPLTISYKMQADILLQGLSRHVVNIQWIRGYFISGALSK